MGTRVRVGAVYCFSIFTNKSRRHRPFNCVKSHFYVILHAATGVGNAYKQFAAVFWSTSVYFGIAGIHICTVDNF